MDKHTKDDQIKISNLLVIQKRPCRKYIKTNLCKRFILVGDTRFELVTSTLSRFFLSVASSYFIRKLNEMGVLSFAFRVKRSYFSLFWERIGNAFSFSFRLVPDNDYTQKMTIPVKEVRMSHPSVIFYLWQKKKIIQNTKAI